MNNGVLDRATAILGCFCDDDAALSAQDIALRTGLAISTVHRFLAKFIDGELVSRTPEHEYEIGIQIWRLGERAPTLRLLRETAMPVLTRLFEATHENVHLAVMTHSEQARRASALFVSRIRGDASFETLARTGETFSLSTTGVGQALLSIMSDQWLTDYRAFALGTPMHRRLTEEVALTRARGYAVISDGITPGGVSVAAPVHHRQGLPPPWRWA